VPTRVPLKWTADQIPDLTGRHVLITGANSGIGLETARELARHRARVLIAVRDERKGRQAAAEIADSVPGAQVQVGVLDLADLDSVRRFADTTLDRRAPLDVLINNAGISATPHRLSPQGHELQFATNHLGHFALTNLLLPVLATERDPRVVTLSSGQHKGGQIHFDDLTGEHGYAPLKYYRQSKLANVLFALELDRRLRGNHSLIRSLLAHPGYAATNLQTNGPTGLYRLVGILSSKLIAQSAVQAALPSLYAATVPDVDGGQFYGPDRLGELRGHPTLVAPDPAAQDRELADRLWTASEELTGVAYPFAVAP
jgi:NAD(P)-dependent dehydrogenase (short-subunit alcohol dehydrogenase family)